MTVQESPGRSPKTRNRNQKDSTRSWIFLDIPGPVEVEVDEHEHDSSLPPGQALGQFATFAPILDEPGSGDAGYDGGPVLTVQATRERARRFVLIGPDGHEVAAGDDLSRLLARSLLKALRAAPGRSRKTPRRPLPWPVRIRRSLS